MLEQYSSSLTWLVVIGFIIAFILAFGIGANDVANSFGTSVGSKVLTVFQACCLATFFEVAGSILIGYKVSDTMRKGILDVGVYKDAEMELMLGSISALGSSAIWLIVATFFKLPISGTHSIVGATVGFSLVARGTHGVNWGTLAKIIGSWFISPILSGLTSTAILMIIKICILRKSNPLEAGLMSLPFFYSFTILVNVFSVVHDGPKLLHMDNIPLWMAGLISITISLVCMLIIRFVVVPWQRKELVNGDVDNIKANNSVVNFNIGESTDTSPEQSPKTTKNRQLTVISELTEMKASTTPDNSTKYIFPIEINNKNGYTQALKETECNQHINNRPNELKLDDCTIEVNPALSPCSSGVPLIRNKSFAKQNQQGNGIEIKLDKQDEMENKSVSKLFSFLQILTAMFGSFAHGGNDVSNAIGPLITLWLIYSEGSVQQKSETPLFILLYGGFGISVGLWLWGRRVIQTIGEDLTTINPST